MPNKYAYLTALAEIREYLRDVVGECEYIKSGLHDNSFPDGIVNDFNLVAKKLGADENWCAS